MCRWVWYSRAPLCLLAQNYSNDGGGGGRSLVIRLILYDIFLLLPFCVCVCVCAGVGFIHLFFDWARRRERSFQYDQPRMADTLRSVCPQRAWATEVALYVKSKGWSCSLHLFHQTSVRLCHQHYIQPVMLTRQAQFPSLHDHSDTHSAPFFNRLISRI